MNTLNFVLLLICLLFISAYSIKLSDSALNDLEKSWENGDEEDELEDEFEHNKKIHSTKLPKVDINDGAAIRKAYNSDPFIFSGSNGSMFFVDLKSNFPKDQVDKLAKRYSSLMRSGSLTPSIYNIGEGRLLVNCDKSWRIKDMVSFLARQPEVDFMTINSKKYTPDDILDAEDDEF